LTTAADAVDLQEIEQLEKSLKHQAKNRWQPTFCNAWPIASDDRICAL